MIGIIWYYSKKDEAQDELMHVVQEYKRLGIDSRTRVNSTICDAVLENGDYWKTSYASNSSRGSCCNISLIARDIPEEIVNTVIKRCTKNMPYRAYNYYGSVETES